MKKDDRLDGLLAKGRLGGPRRDQVLEGALQAAGIRRRRWPRVVFWATSLAATAVALVFMLRPGGFRARGGGGPVLEVVCRGGQLAACAAGDKLMFRVSGAGDGGYLAAWAEPALGGGRIWYLDAARVPPNVEPQLLPTAITLGAEHAPGRYQIHLVLANRALSRDEVVALPPGAALATARAELEVRP